ncbi:hypothetical protein O181_076991 [Austropuccinia psidii MF-1]|uniref:ATP-dependent DNA helicase n=1 Tax=Austropuccinia psidii MF-1 TaxID=1389203 RepID=A0A9Q3FH99_9BASI|nr:hypothetical protein [Austropuccinia psidii MF-1]
MEHLSDNFQYNFKRKGIIEEPSEKDVHSYCLYLLKNKLDLHNRTFHQVGLNIGLSNLTTFKSADHRIQAPKDKILEVCSANTLTDEQKRIFEKFKNVIASPAQSLGFLEGPGGSGKTYLLNCILLECEKLKLIVAAVCASGIAALLLLNGTTAHLAFGIRLNVQEDSTCNINATPICFRAVDCSLKDLRKSERPFGGISVLFSGDSRQILPIVKNGNIYDQAVACLKKSYVWRLLTQYSLTQNLWCEAGSGIVSKGANDFAIWLQQLGNGALQQWDIEKVKLSHLKFQFSKSLDSLKHELTTFVYGDLDKVLSRGTRQMVMECFECGGVVTPLNLSVHDINSLILERQTSRKYVSRSIDVCHENSLYDVPVEVLNSIQVPGFPRHKIDLKQMTPVILLRNLNIAKGLCNGTTLLVCEIRPHVLVCTFISGWNKGNTGLLRKIKLHHEEDKRDGFCFSRYQFVIELAYAITINKAQGQSFKHVGVYLSTDVFSHGQMYVALSRACNKANVLVCGHGKANVQLVTKVVVRSIAH